MESQQTEAEQEEEDYQDNCANEHDDFEAHSDTNEEQEHSQPHTFSEHDWFDPDLEIYWVWSLSRTLRRKQQQQKKNSLDFDILFWFFLLNQNPCWLIFFYIKSYKW